MASHYDTPLKGAYLISSNIAIAILDCSLLLPFSYRSSNYCDSISCRYYLLLKAIAKRKGKIISLSRS